MGWGREPRARRAVESACHGDLRGMLLHAPRAVVLVCDAAAADAPAVGSECAGYVVVACFTCTHGWPSGALLRELAEVAEALCVDEALIMHGARGVAEVRIRPTVIPLARDSSAGATGHRTLS